MTKSRRTDSRLLCIPFVCYCHRRKSGRRCQWIIDRLDISEFEACYAFLSCSFHCFGVEPVYFLKRLIKYDTSSIPHRAASSATGTSLLARRISLAISTLVFDTRELLLSPVCAFICLLRLALLVYNESATACKSTLCPVFIRSWT